MRAVEPPLSEASQIRSERSENSSSKPDVLSHFYLAPSEHTEVNMITHPLLLESYEREAQMRERLYTEPVLLQLQIDKMHVLLREFKRRASQQIDYDRMMQLAKENAALRRENEQLLHKLALTSQELTEKTELLTTKGIFAIKVRFSQARDEFFRRLTEADGAHAVSIKLLGNKVAELERKIALSRMTVPNSYSRVRLSDKILPAQHLDQSMSYEAVRLHDRSRSGSRRNRIFQSPSKRKVGQLMLADEVGNLLTREEVEGIKESIKHFEEKLQVLQEQMSVMERSQCTNSEHSHPQTVKVQALLAESKLITHDANEFLSLLQKIQVLKSDLHSLDREALGVAKQLRNNPLSEALVSNFRSTSSKR